MYTTDLNKDHEFIGANVYDSAEIINFGKVTEMLEDANHYVTFKTDSGYEFSSWDVESFDMDNTIILF